MAVAAHESHDIYNEDGSVNEDKLAKLTKSDLISCILQIGSKDKQEDRQKQWGQQFDIWLIRAAKRNAVIDFFLDPKSHNLISHSVNNIPGAKLKNEELFLTAIPRRVDKYEIQIQLEDGSEIWLNKTYIVGCINSKKEFSIKE